MRSFEQDLKEGRHPEPNTSKIWGAEYTSTQQLKPMRKPESKFVQWIRMLWVNKKNLHVILAAEVFLGALKKDKGAQQGYQAAIAMCVYDELKRIPGHKTIGRVNLHAVGNNVGKRFLAIWLAK